MLAFNPLLKHDFFGGMSGFRRHGMDAPRGLAERPAPAVSSDQIQVTLTQAYQKMQATVESRFPAVNTTDPAADVSAEDNDYSPQAVADRIVGFITDRLAQEKANGASQERLQSLYQQALKGVEQGLREGRDIIDAQGLFSGDTKDTFYQTVNLVADRLQQLGEELFGTDLDTPAADNVEGESTSTVPAPTTSTGFEARSTQVQIERSRSFAMEVLTQEGDRVKIMVNSGQSFSSNQVSYNDSNTSIDGFEASFSSFDNLSFSVEGDLNESELAALNDLFSQVNDVAATFYGGDVEAAFNQAMDVGMNPEQLASFAVNINQSESVAVRDTYVAVQNMAKTPRRNPYQDLFQSLGNFADKTRKSAEALTDKPQAQGNMRALYADLIGRLHSGHGRHQGHGDAFQRFANRLAG